MFYGQLTDCFIRMGIGDKSLRHFLSTIEVYHTIKPVGITYYDNKEFIIAPIGIKYKKYS